VIAVYSYSESADVHFSGAEQLGFYGRVSVAPPPAEL
jgi:hypothetical protein